MNQFPFKKELRRKIIHIIVGIVLIGSALFFQNIDAIFWVSIALLIPATLFYLITKWFSHTKIGQLAFHSVEREQGHHTNGVGGITYILGVILSYIIFGFNPSIVIVSIIVLAFGDGFASYFGMRFGKHKINIEGHTKTLEGTLAGVVAATLVSLMFVDFFYALATVSLTMIIELVGIRIKGKEVPDNIYLPLVSGAILYILILFT